jgi:hypothetical protein
MFVPSLGFGETTAGPRASRRRQLLPPRAIHQIADAADLAMRGIVFDPKESL